MEIKLDASRLKREVVFTAVRSRGPGGQNVNKVSSAALLTWDFNWSQLLSEYQKTKLRAVSAHWMTTEGIIHFRADEYRDLERNKARALEKLIAAVTTVLHVPKKRRATKPTFSSKRKRLDTKTKHGDKKNLRRKVSE